MSNLKELLEAEIDFNDEKKYCSPVVKEIETIFKTIPGFEKSVKLDELQTEFLTSMDNNQEKAQPVSYTNVAKLHFLDTMIGLPKITLWGLILWQTLCLQKVKLAYKASSEKVPTFKPEL